MCVSAMASKQNLKGSERRDTFKFLHKKRMPGWYYATDIDFALVSKEPPGIIAFLDFKTPWEDITFAEVLAYNVLLGVAPIYIVQSSSPESGPFRVLQYVSGDWHPEPPVVNLVPMQECMGWEDLTLWEAGLRARWGTR